MIILQLYPLIAFINRLYLPLHFPSLVCAYASHGKCLESIIANCTGATVHATMSKVNMLIIGCHVLASALSVSSRSIVWYCMVSVTVVSIEITLVHL